MVPDVVSGSRYFGLSSVVCYVMLFDIQFNALLFELSNRSGCRNTM